MAATIDYVFYLEKQPSEKITFSVDFAKDLGSSEEISSVAVTAIDTADGSDVSGTILNGSAQIQNGDQTNSKVAQKVKAGTGGATYKISFEATTDDPHVFESDLNLRVKEQ